MATHVKTYALSEDWSDECDEEPGRLVYVLIDGVLCLVYRHFIDDEGEEKEDQ